MGFRSENCWGCAAGHWKLDPKRSREKWYFGAKKIEFCEDLYPKDCFCVGGWEKTPQKDRVWYPEGKKRGSKPRHICITHHIGSNPPPPPPGLWHLVLGRNEWVFDRGTGRGELCYASTKLESALRPVGWVLLYSVDRARTLPAAPIKPISLAAVTVRKHGVCAIRSLPAQAGLCWHTRTLPAQ